MRLFIIFFLLITSLSSFPQADEYLFSPEGVAEIHIQLLDNKKISDIKNDEDEDYAGKLRAEITVANSKTSHYEDEQLFTGFIRIEGRGYSSWSLDKKPYNIDFMSETGEELPIKILGMPKCDEWCLLAGAFDRTLLRFPLATYIGQHLEGIPWTPRNRFVELWINDEYLGLYTLAEKIMKDKSRVDIQQLEAADENISGGYIVELNTKVRDPLEIEKQFFTTLYNIPICFKYPKPRNVSDKQRTWLMQYFNDFETALNSSAFKDLVNGYAKYIDTESFIDWTILMELCGDEDHGNNISNYLHKDRDNKLFMTAPWDFDRAFGAYMQEAEPDLTNNFTYVRLNHWYGRLAEDPAYLLKYKDRMDALRKLFATLPDVLDANYAQLIASGAIDREYEKWGNSLPSMTDMPDYKSEFEYLQDWLVRHTGWCYKSLGMPTFNESLTQIKDLQAVENKLYYSDGKNISIPLSGFMVQTLTIKIFTITGQYLTTTFISPSVTDKFIEISTSGYKGFCVVKIEQ